MNDGGKPLDAEECEAMRQALDEGFRIMDYATAPAPEDGSTPPERLNDKDDWVLEMNRDHPRYKYIREMVLHALNDYGWYYGVPHAIFYRTESPEFIQRIGHTLQRWGCAIPRWLDWTGIGERMRNWATAIVMIRDKPIEIRRGFVFHDLEILPYGPDAEVMAAADQTRSRHDIYQDGLEAMRRTFSVEQLNGSDLVPMPGQGTMLIYQVMETYRQLGRLHGVR